jgi:hypothetical protein
MHSFTVTLLVASLDCRTRCTIKLSIADAKSGTGISGEITAQGPTDVGLKHGPIQPGELLVNMHIDDSPDLQGRSLFGDPVGPASSRLTIYRRPI